MVIDKLMRDWSRGRRKKEKRKKCWGGFNIVQLLYKSSGRYVVVYVSLFQSIVVHSVRTYVLLSTCVVHGGWVDYRGGGKRKGNGMRCIFCPKNL